MLRVKKIVTAKKRKQMRSLGWGQLGRICANKVESLHEGRVVTRTNDAFITVGSHWEKSFSLGNQLLVEVLQPGSVLVVKEGDYVYPEGEI